MALTVYWSLLAEEKLEDIFNYYKQKAGHNAAQKVLLNIIDRTSGLEKNPQIGRKEELLKNRSSEFRYLVYSNYKIIYWINNKKQRIEIANIFDTRQNPNKIQETK